MTNPATPSPNNALTQYEHITRAGRAFQVTMSTPPAPTTGFQFGVFLAAVVAFPLSSLYQWPAVSGILILAAVLAALIWSPPSGLRSALSFRTAKDPR